ncbi:hypothetical protein Rsub_11325 [Raphidocelis subcapitata]|uniref:Uncharacterized protein n=1 Tax=Raphidocelis subcapitata TaxID=307507 RepID=A0A2V0PL39_9CHLO|nr:hypothetical protein Rsub_11325 [Raphidocelis subcapitata]|eukprot:GBF98600.1 hypothetical protein Rsub_11325 [Raphidocelis subcapitata]
MAGLCMQQVVLPSIGPPRLPPPRPLLPPVAALLPSSTPGLASAFVAASAPRAAWPAPSGFEDVPPHLMRAPSPGEGAAAAVALAELEAAVLATGCQQPDSAALAYQPEGALLAASAWAQAAAAAAAYAAAVRSASGAPLPPLPGAFGAGPRRIQSLPPGGSYGGGGGGLLLEGAPPERGTMLGGGFLAAGSGLRPPLGQSGCGGEGADSALAARLFASPSDASTITAAGPLDPRALPPAWPPPNGATAAAWEDDDEDGGDGGEGAVSVPILGVELRPDGTAVRLKAEGEAAHRPAASAWQRRARDGTSTPGGGSPPPSPLSPRLGSDDGEEGLALPAPLLAPLAPPLQPLPPPSLLQGGGYGSSIGSLI